MMSLTMTRAVGSRNQMMPSNSRLTKKELGMNSTCTTGAPRVVQEFYRVGRCRAAVVKTSQVWLLECITRA